MYSRKLENIILQEFLKVKLFIKISCKILNMETIFQKRLKELRMEKGVSQQQLGGAIGATYSAVSYWENGTNEPKIGYLIALCKYFNVTSDYLLGLSD